MTTSSGPVFSFIVPIYNTAELLPRCLDSILAQRYFGIEIILIDDGSTDASYEVCQRYANRHSCIRVLAQSNQGQGAARNLGIERARGEFVCFVDSDDWIDPAYCQTVSDAFRRTQADFVNFGYTFRNEAGAEVRRLMPPSTPPPSGREIFLNALLIKGIVSSPWTKAVRRTLLVENDVRFPPVRVNEDILFSCLVAHAARSTAFVPSVLYHAIIRTGSTSRVMSSQVFHETGQMIELARGAFSSDLHDPKVALHFDAHVARVFTYLLFQGAARMQTSDDLGEAFAVADTHGLNRIVKAREAIQLLSVRNRVMARFTARRWLFRPVVRMLRRLLIRSY